MTFPSVNTLSRSGTFVSSMKLCQCTVMSPSPQLTSGIGQPRSFGQMYRGCIHCYSVLSFVKQFHCPESSMSCSLWFWFAFCNDWRHSAPLWWFSSSLEKPLEAHHGEKEGKTEQVAMVFKILTTLSQSFHFHLIHVSWKSLPAPMVPRLSWLGHLALCCLHSLLANVLRLLLCPDWE